MKTVDLLSVLLYLIALHSMLVGIALMAIPIEKLEYFGYHNYQGTFFKIQGGVFHIVMSGVYILAAINLKRNSLLVYLTLFAKFAATVFLFSYYFFVDPIWMVAASGAGDLVMGVMILWLFLKLKRT